MNVNLKLDKQPLLAVGLTVGFWLSGLISILATRQAEGVSPIWLADGFLAAGFLLLNRTWAVRMAVVCFVLLFCTRTLSGDPASTTILFGLLNLFEAAAAAFVARKVLGPTLRITNVRRVALMIVFGIIAPGLAAAAMASVICGYVFHTPFFTVMRDWFMADATGMGPPPPVAGALPGRPPPNPFKALPPRGRRPPGLRRRGDGPGVRQLHVLGALRGLHRPDPAGVPHRSARRRRRWGDRGRHRSDRHHRRPCLALYGA